MGEWMWRRKFVPQFQVRFFCFWKPSYFVGLLFSFGACFTCMPCNLGQADYSLDSDFNDARLWDFMLHTIPKCPNVIMITVCPNYVIWSCIENVDLEDMIRKERFFYHVLLKMWKQAVLMGSTAVWQQERGALLHKKLCKTCCAFAVMS